MAKRLFEAVEQWSIEEPETEFLGLADELELDVEAFEACLNSRQAMEWVMGDQTAGRGVVNSTPTFIGVYGGAGYVYRGARGAEEFAPLLETMVSRATGGE
jgi:predicted DsbA family dithiol-disulfide isomerase